ncbi:outer membrane beta-barrel protein [Treponema ruminis]|uniref:Outer membrane protein beta-barrel domain-containing protein n=1 Tax=Treponema ruminis TaxID=744515 RepID=A0A7W8LM91_9SPIR|nr:outer membrane beta-barrel protein [Treponema ruminis]MBB5226279.1 hypothetical protein [Treponema ruminis]
MAAPVASDGKDTVTAAGNSWGYGARTARLNVNGKSEDGTAGFSMGIYNDVSMSLSAGDEANLWIKPLDIVKVSYGKYDNNTLRGDLCYGSWNWLRPTSSWIAEDEGLLMSGNGATGLMAEITPMENLYIQALVPITTTQTKADETYKNLRGGFAYTIPGTAKIKAQYIGKGKGSVDAEDATSAYYEFMRQRIVTTDDADTAKNKTKADGEYEGWTYHAAKDAVKKADGNSDCTFEAEVDVLAVENLFLGLGIQYNNIKDADKSAKIDNQMKIALGATYQVNDDLKLSASGAFFTYYKTKDVKTDSRFQAGAGVDYNLGDGLSANADFRYLSKFGIDGEKADNTDSIAFSAGIQKGFSNGYIGVAFQGQTNSGTFANNVITGATNDDGKYKNFVWAIPIALSVWF